MQKTKTTTYRDIAKMLCRALPVEGQDFADKVNEYLDAIKAMPKEAKIALRSAYIFSRKVPREEREDMFQELCLAVLQVKTKNEKFGYAIARCDWKNWWQKFKIRSHYSLDSVVNEDGNAATFGELLVGEAEFERKMDGKIDGEALYQQLPGWVKKLVDKALLGYPIKGGDRQLLNRWVISRPTILANYVK